MELYDLKLPSGFVYLSEIEPNIIQDIKYATNDNFIGRKVDGYEKPLAILKEEVALALRQVHNDLNSLGYALKIFDAYRPIRAVERFVEWANEPDDSVLKRKYYPSMQKKELFKKGYISKNSVHSMGYAVDLTIVNISTNKELNMGTIFDFFGELSHTDNSNISIEAKRNRQFFKKHMEKHGFENLWCEWWHYSLLMKGNQKNAQESFNFIIR